MVKSKRVECLIRISCIIVFNLACAKSIVLSEDDWEGVYNGKLQVCISHESAKPRSDTVLLEAKQRAVVIIINYIKAKYPLLYDSSALEQVIIDCFEKPLILYNYCDEIKCVALISFDIKPVLDILEGMDILN